MRKILSVSIAAYNVAQTLAECLDPFLETGVMDELDIMVIDDGSSDDTRKIAEQYTRSYPDTFRIISKENGGWGSTVNTGIREARGLYFKQLDGDDHYDPAAVGPFVRYLRSEPGDLVITPYIAYDSESGTVISKEDCNPGYEKEKIYLMQEVHEFSPFMHSLSVRTSLLKEGKVSITEHCFYTDTEFVLKACNHARTVSFFDIPVYYYRRAALGQSMSLDGFEKHYMDQYRVIEVCLVYMQQQVKREEVRAIYDKLLFGTCFWQYMIMFYISATGQHKKDLKAFDRMLKEKAPDYYAKIDFKELKILRKTKFIGYFILAPYKKKKDNRFTADGRLRE